MDGAELCQRLRLFHWMDVRALAVLDELDLEHLLGGHVLNEGRDGRVLQVTAREKPALAEDELVALGDRTDLDGLLHAVLCDGVLDLGAVPHPLAGVVHDRDFVQGHELEDGNLRVLLHLTILRLMGGPAPPRGRAAQGSGHQPEGGCASQPPAQDG